MKRYAYIILLLLITVGCQKEETLTPSVHIDDPYVIKDDPNDAVQHQRFLLYDTYGVPVFFNDTVKRVFLTMDVKGDSIFDYELLDMNWRFNSTSNFKYRYDYFKEDSERLQALANVREYLENSVPSLRPFSMLLVKGFEAKGNGDVMAIADKSGSGGSVASLSGFRTLLLAGAEASYSTGFWKEFSIELIRTQVKKTIYGEKYKDAVKSFQVVSSLAWYGQYWNLTNKNLGVEKTFSAANWRKFDPLKTYTGAEDEQFRYIREVFGRFGFIGHSRAWSHASAPDMEEDMDQYIDALLAYNGERFVGLWGDSPMVMKKYGILHNIMVNGMGVPLKEIVK